MAIPRHLRATPFAEFTPERARDLVAKLPPGARDGLIESVRQALTFHRDMGEPDAARFCILILDALREAAVSGEPSTLH